MQNKIETARGVFELGVQTAPKVSAMIYHYYGAFLLQTHSPEAARQFIAQTYNLPLESSEIEQRLAELKSVNPEDIWSLETSISDEPWQGNVDD
jgi:hypothetical protein